MPACSIGATGLETIRFVPRRSRGRAAAFHAKQQPGRDCCFSSKAVVTGESTEASCRTVRPAYFFARLTFSQPLVLSFLSTLALSFFPEPQSTVSFLPLRA